MDENHAEELSDDELENVAGGAVIFGGVTGGTTGGVTGGTTGGVTGGTTGGVTGAGR